ncbi:prepilin peptidase [candidate division KSB1 bacterium]|nr:prepilin peptidase [candidate division KSB1 bacterium]
MVGTPWGPLPVGLVYGLTGFLGLCLGSFANVLIYRLPREESLVTPPSRCPACSRRIKPWENIPVLSYLLLGGRCAGCKVRISIRYPLIELASGILAVGAVHRFGFSYAGVAHGLLFIALLSLVLIDLEHWLLPFAITIPMAVIGLIGALFFELRPIPDALIGMLVGGGIFLLMLIGGKWLFKKDAMGGGDVVFGIMAGSFLGWKLVLLMVFFASLLGTLVALPLLVTGKDLSGKMIPFGPFLAIALVVCLFFGEPALQWYTHLILR